MECPLVSIIVPVYNVEHFLSDCIESLLHQTYSNIEIIAVNDGSKDKSLSILQKYAVQDGRIHVISQNNAGISAARNTGIQHACGKYLLFVDSDDWIDTDTCASVVELAEKESVQVVCWNYMKEYKTKRVPVSCIKENQLFEKDSMQLLQQRIVGPIGKQLSKPQYLDSLSTVWGKLYNANIIKNNKIEFVSTQEIGTAEDLLFNIQYFQYIEKAQLLTTFFSHYRKYNVSSFTSVYKPDLFVKWRNLQRKIFELIHEHSLLIPAYYNRISLSVIGLGFNECCSNDSFHEKVNRIKSYLEEPTYHTALKQLNLKYFPLHWKIFFGCAKYGYYSILLVLIQIINQLRVKQ